MKVALVYDRVNKWGGAERALLALHEMFPQAPLYTSVYNPGTAKWAVVFPKVISSFLQKFPYAIHHELYAPLMPMAFESFNFEGYDLVISVTSEAAKGIITNKKTLHVCYCLTPTRYLWNSYDVYFENEFKRWMTKPVVSYLRGWDRIAAQRPDVMVGISQEVAGRIKRYYGREAKVVYPPVSFDNRGWNIEDRTLRMEGRKSIYSQSSTFKNLPSTFHHPSSNKSYFLIVSRLVPYKRVDLAVEAFNKLGLLLVVVGRGSEEGKLHRMAQDNIHFTSYLTDQELASYYEKATALVFPQEEDFGMAAVEAQSMGTPVIAYRAGGALETVAPGKTGEFFDYQTAGSLIKAVRCFNKSKYDAKFIKAHARRFSKERFKKEFLDVVEKTLSG